MKCNKCLITSLTLRAPVSLYHGSAFWYKANRSVFLTFIWLEASVYSEDDKYFWAQVFEEWGMTFLRDHRVFYGRHKMRKKKRLEWLVQARTISLRKTVVVVTTYSISAVQRLLHSFVVEHDTASTIRGASLKNKNAPIFKE